MVIISNLPVLKGRCLGLTHNLISIDPYPEQGHMILLQLYLLTVHNKHFTRAKRALFGADTQSNLNRSISQARAYDLTPTIYVNRARSFNSGTAVPSTIFS